MRTWAQFVCLASLAFSISSIFILTCSAEQTGTPRRLLAGDYSTHRLGIVDEQGKLEWEYSVGSLHDVWMLENGNILTQTSMTRLIELSPDKKVVWEYHADKANGNAGKKVEVHAFQRLPNGRTMIAESGPARIIEVDAEGKLLAEMKLTVKNPNPHRDTRLVRKLASGNYLVAHEGDKAVREYSPDGKVVWEYAVGSSVYSAIRLDNGNTLMGTGDGHRVLEVNSEGKEVWSVNANEIEGVKLAWITMVERLPNGNTFIVNCHAGPENPQLLEVSPEKKLVWSFKDFKKFGNALPVARLLPAASAGK